MQSVRGIGIESVCPRREVVANKGGPASFYPHCETYYYSYVRAYVRCVITTPLGDRLGDQIPQVSEYTCGLSNGFRKITMNTFFGVVNRVRERRGAPTAVRVARRYHGDPWVKVGPESAQSAHTHCGGVLR